LEAREDEGGPIYLGAREDEEDEEMNKGPLHLGKNPKTLQ